MTHKATKNYEGNYTYKNNVIAKTECGLGRKQEYVWTIRPEGSSEDVDSQDTLRDAKAVVDYFLDN